MIVRGSEKIPSDNSNANMDCEVVSQTNNHSSEAQNMHVGVPNPLATSSI